MKTHRFDPTSFVLGLVVLAVAAAYLVGALTDVTINSAWLLPGRPDRPRRGRPAHRREPQRAGPRRASSRRPEAQPSLNRVTASRCRSPAVNTTGSTQARSASSVSASYGAE